jgi:HK97 gp10 family phage protein
MSITVNIRGTGSFSRILDRINRIGLLGQHDVEAGIFAKATNSKSGENIAKYMRANEFGTLSKNGKLHIPPRPFLRTAVKKHKKEWIQRLIKEHNAGTDIKKAMDRVGEQMAGDIKMSIQGWKIPANDDATVARKGFNDPLVHTSEALNAVSYDVITKKGAKRKTKGKNSAR